MNFLVFLDISPLGPGHAQVIPKKHYRYVWDVPDAGRYFEIVKNSNYGSLSFELGYPEKQWTKMDLFNELDMNTDEHLNNRQLMATSFILKKCNHTMKLVSEWHKYSSIYSLIDDSQSNAKNDNMFCEHRHDQSIFSLIRKKYGTEKIYNDVDSYNNFSPIKAKRIRE